MNIKNSKEGLVGGLSSNSAYSTNNKISEKDSVNKQKQAKTPEEIFKEFEEIKKNLEDTKKKILKKYSFTRFISILPELALPLFAEDENMPREVEHSNPILMMVCIPEDKFKEITKIREGIVEMVKESKQNVWVLLKTEVDLWNYGLDSKFEFLDAISSSFVLHDAGFLGAFRVANIHKMLVLKKFEKYVASYVIAGSLVRGTAGEGSDVDTFVIIDDTDVKKMPRIELLERLRGFIMEYVKEATIRAGVKNVLNVQVYLLTDFWQSVKDANPIMFTFIRDGIPLYDRGTFIPWKLLLKMGKIKPSPEAVDMFMKSGEQTDSFIKRRMLDAMVDVYWGIVTPTQALMMLAGHAPPEPKTIFQEAKNLFVTKEKFLKESDLKTLEKSVKLYKDYEHGVLKEISGKEIDELKKASDEYFKKMKELRTKIEIRMQEHTIKKANDDILALLRTVYGNKNKDELIKSLSKFVKDGKIHKNIFENVKTILNLKAKSKRMTQTEIQRILGNTTEFLNIFTEYMQRKELVVSEKGIIQIRYKDKKAEIIITNSSAYFVEGEIVKKIESKGFVDSTKQELENDFNKTKGRLSLPISNKIFDLVRKQIGDFEIIL